MTEDLFLIASISSWLDLVIILYWWTVAQLPSKEMVKVLLRSLPQPGHWVPLANLLLSSILRSYQTEVFLVAGCCGMYNMYAVGCCKLVACFLCRKAVNVPQIRSARGGHRLLAHRIVYLTKNAWLALHCRQGDWPIRVFVIILHFYYISQCL